MEQKHFFERFGWSFTWKFSLEIRLWTAIFDRLTSLIKNQCHKLMWLAHLGLQFEMLSSTDYGRMMAKHRVSVQGVKSLGGHFASFVIIFKKENGNTFTLFIISIVKSLQKEQNSTNLLLWPPICRNKSAITSKWFNSLDTNSNGNPLVHSDSNWS